MSKSCVGCVYTRECVAVRQLCQWVVTAVESYTVSVSVFI